MRDRRAGAAQGAHVLDVEIVEEVFVDDRVDPAGRRGRASWPGAAVDEDLQPPKLAGGVAHGSFDAVAVRHVAGDGQHAPSGRRRDLSRRSREFILGARADSDIDTLAREFERDRLADSAAATDHQAAFPCQSQIHRSILSTTRPRGDDH